MSEKPEHGLPSRWPTLREQRCVVDAMCGEQTIDEIVSGLCRPVLLGDIVEDWRRAEKLNEYQQRYHASHQPTRATRSRRLRKD